MTMDEDGSVQTVNSEEELEALFDDCFGEWGLCGGGKVVISSTFLLESYLNSH